MKRFGYAKGALSQAAEEAFLLWIKKTERKSDVMEVVREVAGCWRIRESGAEYVRKIRKWEEERLKRLGIR